MGRSRLGEWLPLEAGSIRALALKDGLYRIRGNDRQLGVWLPEYHSLPSAIKGAI